MSISIGGKIVTDGLVIHYDALNKRSYPGSGTSWIDLTSYNNTGSLNGGSIPVPIANGYASFSGVNNSEIVNISDIGEINSTTNYATVDMWARVKTPITPNIGGLMFGWNIYGVSFRLFSGGGNLRYFGFDTDIGDVYGIDTTALATLGLENNWKHYSFVFVNGRSDQGNLPKENQKIYINSVDQPLSQVTGTENANNRLFSFGSTSNARFPGFRFASGNNLLINMDVALIKIYNRQLTQLEVTQNFNAHKGRFNIYQ